MNGSPYSGYGNIQHQTEGVQSQIYQHYPPVLNHSYLNSNNCDTRFPTVMQPQFTQHGNIAASYINSQMNVNSQDVFHSKNNGSIPGHYNNSELSQMSNVNGVIYNSSVPPILPFKENNKSNYIQSHPPDNTYHTQPQSNPAVLSNQMNNLQLNSTAQLKSTEQSIDLMQSRNLFGEDFLSSSKTPKTCFTMNCDENIMQCTLNTLPIEANILTKSRLPLGVHIQPFRDTDIMLVQTNTIARCRSCRTYINPFVTLTDRQRRWHCNVCGRVNDIPDEFMYDPATKTYGSPTRRPELQFSNIEYTANPDYTVRPPMSTMYVFCLDVSEAAIKSGYLRYTCDLIIENLPKMPGDNRRQIAFLTYNSCLHFYQIQENSVRMITWSDLSELDLPVSEDLLVSICDRQEVIIDFLRNLPSMFATSMDSGNCMGFAIQIAMKLITHNGGRITVVNASMPNLGSGSLTAREGKVDDQKLIQPATDFYKSLALQCANDQISVDLFCINRQYADIASFATISRYSSGGFYYYGHFKAAVEENQRLESAEQLDFDRFIKDFTRYLTRKIGFEAVMRTRSSKGLELTAFHGNLFMRSTNVIALPVVSPDASYSIIFKVSGSLSEWSHVVIQAALLYTTSESDRRIRVHTLCLPVTNDIEKVFFGANDTAIAGLIAKIAADKCVNDGVGNVREAFVNSLVDPLKVYQGLGGPGRRSLGKSLMCPANLRLLAPLVLGLLRNPGFKTEAATDSRVAMLECIRWLPLTDVLRRVYPEMVAVHCLAQDLPLRCLVATGDAQDDDKDCPTTTTLNLTSALISRDGAFLLDVGDCFYLFLGTAVPAAFLKYSLGVDSLSQMPKEGVMTNFDLDNVVCRRLRRVHRTMGNQRCLGTSVITVTPECGLRGRILQYLVEDRMENAMSYYEFLKSVQGSVYS